MLKANLKKTKSARKKNFFVVAGVTMMIITVLFWGMVLIIANFGLGDDKPKADYLLQTPNQTFLLEGAETQAEREKGLSGRSNLQPYRGMLFVFDREEQQCFWMKNTLIPLDIIWFDAAKKVTHIERGVLPSSYPKNYCATGKFVAELNAGQVDQAQITVGRTLTF